MGKLPVLQISLEKVPPLWAPFIRYLVSDKTLFLVFAVLLKLFCKNLSLLSSSWLICRASLV